MLKSCRRNCNANTQWPASISTFFWDTVSCDSRKIVMVINRAKRSALGPTLPLSPSMAAPSLPMVRLLATAFFSLLTTLCSAHVWRKFSCHSLMVPCSFSSSFRLAISDCS